MNKKGLYANIHAKRERIKKGSGERMRQPGSEGAPTEKDFKDASKTVKEGTDMMEKNISHGMSVSDIAEKHKTSIKAIELQIEKGIKVEKEHTDSEAEAKTIAMDHLVEIPDYYDRLLAMEKEATKELQEKKKKKATARDYNAKAMWGKVKAQTFKAKKGKGSYIRKPKYKGMYESKVLTEGASNFSTMEHFPLLVWLDWEQKVDEWMDEAKQFVEEEYADSFNDMAEDEIEQLVQEKFEEISDQSSKDVAVLSEEEFYDLESDKDEFNIKFRNTFDYEGDVVTIEAGYHEGMQLLVSDEEYFKDEDKAMIEEFLYTMKEKYFLTELGGSGASGMGYTNLGSGKGLNQIELDVEEKEDEDLEEELVPPSKEVVDSFLELLKTNGYNIESVRPDYKELSPEGEVHIQIKSKENKFTEENFEEEYERMSDVIHKFDPNRKFHITYSFGLMNDGYATAGLDIREESVDPKAMVNLDEASKDFSGTPSKDDLKKAAKRHKKTDKKGARGWFVRLGSGDVQKNISRFNARMSGDTGPQTSPTAAGYVAPASAGNGSGSTGVGSAPAGLGEAVEEQYCLTEKVEKHETLNPKLWEGGKLKSEVADKILDAVDLFVEGLEENGIKIFIKDIVLIGSNASYNYSDTSDLDVHLIVDTKELDCPGELYPFLYSSYRSIFNKKYEIDFYGVGVELFVDTEGTQTISNGIYSLNTGWVKEPVKENIPELDQEKFNAEFSKWEDMYFELIKGEKEIGSDEKPIEIIQESLESDKIEKIDSFIEDIYDLRKVSLKSGGEYSIGNLVFKEMRSLGYLDNLKVLKNKLKSTELSLKEAVEKRMFTTLAEIEELTKKIKDGKDGGTYLVDDKGNIEKQNLRSGLQTSFFRPEITDADIKLILDVIGNSFGQQYFGLYQGSGEISYTLTSSLAKEVARIFNQYSVYNNELQQEEKNMSFNETTKVDYKKAAEELLVLLGKKK